MHRSRRRWPEKARNALASFRVRLVLVVLLAVLPGLAFILYSAAEQRRQALDHAKESAARLTQLAAADHANLIEETRQLLEVLARVPVVVGNDPASCRAFLAVVAEAHLPKTTSFGVIDRDGRMYCSSIPGARIENLAGRSYFQQAMRTREFTVGDYVVGRASGRAVLVLAYPVQVATGLVDRIIIAALNLDWLNQFAARAELPPGATLALLDHTGTTLVRQPHPERWVGRPFPNAALLQAKARAGGGVVEAEGIDEVPRLFEVTKLASTHMDGALYLIIGLAKSTLFEESDRILRRNLIMLGAVTLLALLAAWFGGNVFFLRQVNALLGATRRIENGDLSARTGLPRGRGELDQLAETFDRTAARLEERTVALQRVNRMYAVLSGIESVLLRHPERDQLLDAACQIAVQRGNFRLAVIHDVDPATGELRVACQAGTPADDARRAHATVEGAEADGHALIGAVRREGRNRIVNELGAGSISTEVSAALEAYGLCAAAAFPLRVEEKVVGVLTLYSIEPHFFDDAEVRLLDEVAADVSLGLEYDEKERRLQYLANYDALTGLPNRTLFEDRLTQAISQAKQDGRSVGVVSMGIVPMDEIIGTLGHATGDRVLESIARALKSAIRDEDSVARMASDEFVIAFVGLSNVMEVETLAQHVIDLVPHDVVVDGREIPVSQRLGTAIYPDDGADARTLVRNAALARQAAMGGGIAYFSASLEASARRRHRIEQELRRAIDRAELELVYQPVVDLRRREVVGVEALLRWDNEALGQLPPSEFIPIAEEMGLISTLGEWILRAACRQARAWRAWGQDGRSVMRINVNVSVSQLREPTFVDRVGEILHETGLEPRFLALGLEITESALMENVEAAIASLRRLREMGAAVYVDDFGTGYSSLAYLRELPLDWVKIDKSFVDDLPTDKNAVSVTRSIIALGHSLGLEVVAEGVETEAQLASLREIGCDAVQGYLFGQPMSADDIARRYGASRSVA